MGASSHTQHADEGPSETQIDAAFDWVDEFLERETQRVWALEDLLHRTDFSVDLTPAQNELAERISEWLNTNPATLSRDSFEQWLRQVADAATAEHLSAVHLEEHFASWNSAVSVALHWALLDLSVRRALEAWWQNDDTQCPDDTRVWKTFLNNLQTAYGDAPGLPVPELPYTRCHLQRGHKGRHVALLGHDRDYEPWYTFWETNQQHAERLFVAARRCTRSDGPIAGILPEELHDCSLPAKHPGLCRFDLPRHPWIPVTDDISEQTIERLAVERMRETGVQESSAQDTEWWQGHELEVIPVPTNEVVDEWDDEFEKPLTEEELSALKQLADRLSDMNASLVVDDALDPFGTFVKVPYDDVAHVSVIVSGGTFSIGIDVQIGDDGSYSTVEDVDLDDVSSATRAVRAAYEEVPDEVAALLEWDTDDSDE